MSEPCACVSCVAIDALKAAKALMSERAASITSLEQQLAAARTAHAQSADALADARQAVIDLSENT